MLDISEIALADVVNNCIKNENHELANLACSVHDIFTAQCGICYGPVSVTSRCSTKMVQWIELIFDMDASFPILHCVISESG